MPFSLVIAITRLARDYGSCFITLYINSLDSLFFIYPTQCRGSGARHAPPPRQTQYRKMNPSQNNRASIMRDGEESERKAGNTNGLQITFEDEVSVPVAEDGTPSIDPPPPLSPPLQGKGTSNKQNVSFPVCEKLWSCNHESCEIRACRCRHWF